MKIIIADDDHDDASLIREILAEIDELIDLDHVLDGESLIDQLLRESRNEFPFPDLIFLDLNMPRKSGIETLRELKGDKIWSDIPIAILSTASSHDQMAEAYNSGANCYITKPDYYHEWIKVISGMINFFGRKN